MKNILIIALLVIASTTLRAQGQLSGGKHYAQPDLAKFEGKWHYADGTTNFTLVLRKEKVTVKSGTDDFSLDVIQGDYTLAKGEKIINASSKPNPAITSGGFYDPAKSKNMLRFVFTDLGKESKRCQVIFELINGDPTKAKWTLTNTEHIIVGNGHFDPTFSVPEKMVLTKL
jgi:hypothetical protein